MTARPLALVTGGARRIGLAIVEDLAKAGFAVAIHSNSSAGDARRIVDGIISQGGSAFAFEADLENMDEVRALLPSVNRTAGRVSLLINNASIFEDDEIGALDEVLFDRHLALHVKSPSFLAEAFAKQLPEALELISRR